MESYGIVSITFVPTINSTPKTIGKTQTSLGLFQMLIKITAKIPVLYATLNKAIHKGELSDFIACINKNSDETIKIAARLKISFALKDKFCQNLARSGFKIGNHFMTE